MPRNPSPVSTKQQRIAELARRSPQMGFTSLAYLMDLEWLREAVRRTRKDGAPGVDGQTWAEYAEDLESNLASLLDRAKSGTYRAPPVRRAHIPKGKGDETRPIGIPTLEDKVLQRAVVMLLEPIYEHDFYDCSHGYRKYRSPHTALRSLWKQMMDHGGCWLVEVDIRRFFDSVDHAHARAFLQERVRDGVLQRLVGKWLKAGVLEDGMVSHPDEGTPQGGVISPALANLYLHVVLDRWFEKEVKPRMHGPSFLVRYADDAVLGFACRDDAERVLRVLPKRFARFGLQLHPEKTRIVPFRRPPRGVRPRDLSAGDHPGCFDFLGFRHYWAHSRKGHWAIKRKTAQDRLSGALYRISEWCRMHRHDPLEVQRASLAQKMQGHFNYYGVRTNDRPAAFRRAVERLWHKWLNRRGGRPHDWPTFRRLLRRYPLPHPKVVHVV